ncbi:MAG TPA: GWxTD domain-containing protein [Bryobacteraceae bacterium]
MTAVVLYSSGSAAITRALLHFIWEGALIALALALLLEVFRPRSARFRYAAACAAMLAMLAAFGLTIARSWPQTSAPVPVHPVRLQMAPPPAFPSAPAPANHGDRLRWLVPLWMTGVALFGARSLASWLAAQRLRHTGICAPSDYWQRKIVELAETIRLSRPVALLESCLTEVPVVVGWLRPVVLFPAGLLSGFPPEQVEYFLLHELAHVRRWDYLVNFIQSLAEDALFYHPAVWWVSAKIRSERENCCDDVVAERGDARGFAAALAALEQSLLQNRNAARMPALAVNGGKLMHRIQRLLGRPESPRGAVAPALLAGALTISIAVAIGATQPPSPGVVKPWVKPPRAENPAPLLLAQAPSNPQPNGQADTRRQTPYEKWLNEEVVYIISPEERTAFRALGTDEERQHFIEQFWQRRDPTPGTPENEFLEEHYRRIAYANENFASNSVPGWKTDRGMIYIKYGPPDEREEHPTGGAYERPLDQGGGIVTVYPFDKWLYRYIQGIGNNVNIEFVDPSGTGDYRMSSDPNEKNTAPVQPPPGPGGRGPGPRGPAAQATEQFRTLQASAPPPAVAPKATGSFPDAPTPAPAASPEAATAPAPAPTADSGFRRSRETGATIVLVAPRVSGTISSVRVQNGQTVRQGQPLVDIDSGSDSPFNHILSPIDGVISNSTAQVGGRAEPGVPLMTVSPAPVAAAAPLPSPNPQVQTLSAERPPENIVEAIDFRGSRRVSQDTLRALIFTKPGDPYNENVLQRDLRSLWNTGRFGEIAIERQAGQRGWIVHFVLGDRSIASAARSDDAKSTQQSQVLDAFKGTQRRSESGPAPDAVFEADVKATMYQAGFEAGYLCYSQGGTFGTCNDPAFRQFQAGLLEEAVKAMNRIVKQSGYTPTPEARKALAVLQKSVADARTERLQAR